MAAIWSTQVIGTRKADPLGFMISLAADTEQPITTRMAAANAVIPFLYPKLSAQTVESHVMTTRVDGRDLIAELEARISRAPLLEAEAPHAATEASEEPRATDAPDDQEAA